MKIMRAICTTILCFAMHTAIAAEFRLNSGAPESLSNDTNDAFYNLIAIEIFKRLGMTLHYSRLPSERSLIQANNGIDDGNIARVKGIEKKWSHLIRVPESIIKWHFSAYSHSDDISINGWESLRSYPVGFVRGWQIYQNKMSGVKNVILANTPDQLFTILKKGHIKIALFEQLQSHYWFKKMNYTPVKLSPTLAKKSLYIYLHEKHHQLVPRMAVIISQMKQDGTYQRIYNQCFGQLGMGT